MWTKPGKATQLLAGLRPGGRRPLGKRQPCSMPSWLLCSTARSAADGNGNRLLLAINISKVLHVQALWAEVARLQGAALSPE